MGNISHLLVPTSPIIHLPSSLMSFTPGRSDYTGDLLSGFPMFNHYAFRLSPFQGNESDLALTIRYSYDQEKVTPYSYQVYLDGQQTTVRFAPSNQSAMYEVRFETPASEFLTVTNRKEMIRF